jgi:hypothetical protein
MSFTPVQPGAANYGYLLMTAISMILFGQLVIRVGGAGEVKKRPATKAVDEETAEYLKSRQDSEGKTLLVLATIECLPAHKPISTVNRASHRVLVEKSKHAQYESAIVGMCYSWIIAISWTWFWIAHGFGATSYGSFSRAAGSYASAILVILAFAGSRAMYKGARRLKEPSPAGDTPEQVLAVFSRAFESQSFLEWPGNYEFQAAMLFYHPSVLARCRNQLGTIIIKVGEWRKIMRDVRDRLKRIFGLDAAEIGGKVGPCSVSITYQDEASARGVIRAPISLEEARIRKYRIIPTVRKTELCIDIVTSLTNAGGFWLIDEIRPSKVIMGSPMDQVRESGTELASGTEVCVSGADSNADTGTG